MMITMRISTIISLSIFPFLPRFSVGLEGHPAEDAESNETGVGVL